MVILLGVLVVVWDCCCECVVFFSVVRWVRELLIGERGMGFDCDLCVLGLDGFFLGFVCIVVGSGCDGIII